MAFDPVRIYAMFGKIIENAWVKPRREASAWTKC